MVKKNIERIKKQKQIKNVGFLVKISIFYLSYIFSTCLCFDADISRLTLVLTDRQIDC